MYQFFMWLVLIYLLIFGLFDCSINHKTTAQPVANVTIQPTTPTSTPASILSTVTSKVITVRPSTECQYPPLQNMYRRQNASNHTYKNVCQLQFIHLYKLQQGDAMLLFGSIFNSQSNQLKADFKFLKELALLLKKDKLQYRLMIRVMNNNKSNAELATVNNIDYTIQLSGKQQNEYLIPATFNTISQAEQPIRLNVSSHLQPLITTSYVMVCLK